MVVTAVRTEQRITQMGGGTRISPAMERKEFSYVKEKYKEEDTLNLNLKILFLF